MENREKHLSFRAENLAVPEIITAAPSQGRRQIWSWTMNCRNWKSNMKRWRCRKFIPANAKLEMI